MSVAPESTLTSIVWLPATRGPVAKATRRSWLFVADTSTLVQAPPSTLTRAWPILGPVGPIHASPSPESAVTANEPGAFDRRTLPPKAALSTRVFHDPLVSYVIAGFFESRSPVRTVIDAHALRFPPPSTACTRKLVCSLTGARV